MAEEESSYQKARKSEWPKYLVIYDGGKLKRFHRLTQAAVDFDSGMIRVEIGDDVLEADFSLRPMTKEETSFLNMATDDYSDSK